MARRRATRGAKKTKRVRAKTRKPALRGSKRTVRLRTRKTVRPFDRAPGHRPKAAASTPERVPAPGLNRARRTLEETVPTPPSSPNMDRHGSAIRAGCAELAESRLAHARMTPAINLDVSVEKVCVTGDEARGNNPTPDQDIVDDIGKAIGIEYQDDEELGASDKVVERDKHRWKLDPACSEDYKDKK